ncbi:virulence-associated E family protein [Nostoc punctiforme]|uniref:Virulence-associated E family protein n=1 Tax=Nostoc punctiforme (strain ATCC 29133 / PCC 73102) TaxID=63737 RepID=B2IT02_NOSP7|nr:virulence-associated E family protein [Nostoc punctiforme]ACC79500.1 virulence-associated E family protein [Nostoc punctiforme PCC 73102]
MNYSNDNSLNPIQSSFDVNINDHYGVNIDSDGTTEFKLNVVKNAGVLRTVTPLGGDKSRGADPKAKNEINGGRQMAKQMIKGAEDKPQMFWKLFEAVYSDVRFNSWKQEYEVGGERVEWDSLMCRFEDVVCSRKGSEAFLKSRRRDFESRKGFNPMKEILEEYHKDFVKPVAMEEVATEDEEIGFIEVKKGDIRRWDEQVFTPFPQWDELSSLLFGTSDPLHQKMLEVFLIGAASRAVNPGKKLDTILVLKSDQGLAKTSFFRALGGEYFVSIDEIESVETTRLLQKGWIGELGELEGITSKADVNALKNWATKEEDPLRRMNTEDIPFRPRHIAFGGTCNSEEILKDTTGNRRFNIIPVTKEIPLDWFRQHRAHILAAAYHKYNEYIKAGIPWWFTKEWEAKSEAQNTNFMEKSQYEDSLTILVASLEGKYSRRDAEGQPIKEVEGIGFTLPDIMEGLGIHLGAQKQGRLDTKIGKLLESLGYQKKKTRVLGLSTPITQWAKADVPRDKVNHLTKSQIIEISRTL